MDYHPTLPYWRSIQKNNFTNWDVLSDFLELNEDQRKVIDNNPRFPLNLPLRLAHKIRKKTIDDPILKQFLPSIEEKHNPPGFVTDPLGEKEVRKESKLLHKYHGRALLLCTSACAMNCRYCFRQYFDYETNDKSYSKELDLIAKDPSIHEIILSGGDPLSLSDSVLRSLLLHLSAMPHIKRIRFHTRFPIGIPERIDSQFLDIFRGISSQIWFVIHTNHPKELDSDIFNCLKTLQRLGIPILSQTVLLKKVNDHVPTLKKLFESLVDNGIFPYYLHQLDRVSGSTHFEVSEEEGKFFINELKKQLPGYAIPKYVREVAGEPYKVPIL